MKRTILILIAMTLTGCVTNPSQNGRTETDPSKTAGFGALVGAAIGGALGKDARSVAIGAAIGGGTGYLYGVNQREQELAEARRIAEEIRQTSGYQPQLQTVAYRDNQGKITNGLKDLSYQIPAQEIERKGALHPKAAGMLAKLNSTVDANKGVLTVSIPAKTPSRIIEDIQNVAPNAHISIGNSKTDYLIRLIAHPLSQNEAIT